MIETYQFSFQNLISEKFYIKIKRQLLKTINFVLYLTS
ncbi:hypothetical protein FSS13T_12630 [Flavobacterium saliperosum S13]|uniref:Uncharacterized protein n=1 Tax=Flavobacterium saliperosum S13 TaxID=1341155 RepID=A0ABN0QGT8_9FLAO|nr:hypothetical protein FSS13T_12630 [Flavobacterium saliperosum S13]